MNEKVTTIIVKYHLLDGYHYFNSDDVIGLHIGSDNLKAAFHDIPDVIEKLMEANYGIACQAVPLQTFDEFLASAHDGGLPRENTSRCFELRMTA